MEDQRMKNLMEENANLKKQLAEQGIELDRSNRQLEIEAALDNVRLRAGAMRYSSELGEASAVLFQQLKALGINTIRTAVGIFDDPNEAMELWLTSYADGGEMTRILYYFNLHIHPVFENIIPARKENNPYVLTILSGNELRLYYQVMSTYFSVARQQVSNETEFFYSFFFTGGTINVVTNKPLDEDQCNTMIRVAQVFGLLYTRFLDLQKAEAGTREAQIESALERIRSRAQAMKHPEELKDVTAVFRNEMSTLGEEELATCQIYVYNETNGKSECMFALRKDEVEGNKIVSGELEIDLHDTWLGREMLGFYGTGAKEVSIAVTGNNYKEWIRYCEARCELLRGYYSEEIDSSYHLCKFSNGAIGRLDTSLIPQESWDLFKRIASVFSLAYSRFKDLTQARIDLQSLKEEKRRAENALMELQATQTQLIQSEKMASLGELTAGIAHEIQNPLNFVNNFSEVNKELVDELQSELKSGNTEEALAISNDIKDNEEKINHHGKRADAIVKGMLQHSRTTSSLKEPTNINALADEYLRLSYHGLRAKDKTFNATLQTEFDKNIAPINIVPQDIGRVLLNLCNNAFYAVNEKAKQQLNGYEPTIAVSSKKKDNILELTVKDNGNGIPQNITDKIFQPFFTTKPTGEGTGLGLSLSYDIIKAHGGEINAETKEGEGSEFVIQLPMK